MKQDMDAVVVVLSSDHVIKDVEVFQTSVMTAAGLSEKGHLVTFGIVPTFPATGYGYVKGGEHVAHHVYSLDKFVEKPCIEKAKEYLASGECEWNSGMFVWKVSKILDDFKRYLPKVYEKLNEISQYIGTEKEEEMINKLYSEIPSISVDYGIMERSNEVVVIPGDFGWNDLGSWDVLGSIYPTDDEGNIKRGENIVLDTRDSIIYSDQKIITTVGVKDLIIVSTEDSVMVCPKDRAQDVKYIVEKLKEEEKHVYL